MEQKELMSKTKEQSRDSVIVRTSIIGILTNVFLAAFKAVIFPFASTETAFV